MTYKVKKSKHKIDKVYYVTNLYGDQDKGKIKTFKSKQEAIDYADNKMEEQKKPFVVIEME